MADSGGDRGGVVASNVAPGETSTSGDGQDPKKSDMGDPQDLRAGKAELKACDDPMQELLNMAAGTVNQTETSHTKQWLGGGDEAEARKDSHKHVSGPLQALPLSLDDIRASLDNIVQQHCLAQSSQLRSLTGEALRRLDDAGKAVVVSHSLAAYLSTLETAVLRKVTARIVSDTGLWVSRLFRFFDSSVFFHEESREGLVRVCRLALHAKYPRLAQGEGYQALAPRPPVLYIGAHTRTSLGHHLCSQLGLPVSCLRIIPLTGTPGTLYQTDLSALEQCMDEDVAQGRVPTLVVVSAGSPAIGLVDPLQGLQDLCKRHEAWLHVEGLALAALCLVSVPNLSLGHQGLLQRVLHCLRLSEMLRERLDQIPEMEVVVTSARPVARAKSLFQLLFDVVVPVVTFRYLPEEALLEGVEEEEEAQEEESTEVSSETESKRNTPDEATAAGEKAETDAILDDEPSLHDTSYRNNLNSWLAQVLNRDVPRAVLDLLDLDPYGACLRFCPLESAHVFGTTTQDDSSTNAHFAQQAILNATVRQKRKFREALSKHDNLELVEVCNWAGLGGVRFVPNAYVGHVDSLDEKDRDQLNQLNSELVLKLKNTDSAFSLARPPLCGTVCADSHLQELSKIVKVRMACPVFRFGMVTDDLDIEELVGLVLELA
ncbi:hypothetical protein HPB52_003060 [Rhipicephalus sanguineus]|uniref:Pyridoxal-dependent decarboxylase domain-containing protein 1 n=1 Tax=Rhipicephalus sanguineus TaxID=34632 RepID=A0A9D4PHA8_RHISA|nr:hypothetical protein HPB52_003060 [Rhipicephalus sanguineus]